MKTNKTYTLVDWESVYFLSYASTILYKDKSIKVSMIYNKLYYLTFKKKNFYCAI